MFMIAVNQTAGIGLGLFIGCLIGFGLRARSGKVDMLVQGSVWKTAVLFGMAAWLVAALVAMVL